MRLGELLTSQGTITHTQLESALTQQRQTGIKLGTVLLLKGALNPLRLYRSLAAQQNQPFVNLTHEIPDASLLSFADVPHYIRLWCIPYKQVDGKIAFACAELTKEVHTWVVQRFGDQAQFFITTPRDIRHAIEQGFGDQLTEETRLKLYRDAPHLSSRHILNPLQRNGLLSAIALLTVAWLVNPALTWVLFLVGINLFYLLTMSFKAWLFLEGQRYAPKTAQHQSMLPWANDSELPMYSILIPLYHERESVPRLLASMRALDYPKDRLDIKLVVETDDTETINALIEAQPEPYFDIIRVPPSQPRTKPKACTYALNFVRGEYVTIYDAEDQPEPLQLKKAIRAFYHAPDDIVCMQARLNYYNRKETWLTRLFSIEYASLFDFLLPGLEKMRVPIPLGGTSNHIHLKKLREVGAWDPFNVTEDADLGMRLALYGLRTQTLDSVTLEEAPISLIDWLKQRTRWIKGYMQTWLVYMRQPLKIYHRFDTVGFWGFQFFIGGPCIVFLIAPIMWGLSILWAGDIGPIHYAPPWLQLLTLWVLIIGVAQQLWFAWAVIHRSGWKDMWKSALAFPFYWFLHSLASFRALWQLLLKPHFWDKTPHGKTCMQSG